MNAVQCSSDRISPQQFARLNVRSYFLTFESGDWAAVPPAVIPFTKVSLSDYVPGILASECRELVRSTLRH